MVPQKRASKRVRYAFDYNQQMARGVRFWLGFRVDPFSRNTGPGIPVFCYCPKQIVPVIERKWLGHTCKCLLCIALGVQLFLVFFLLDHLAVRTRIHSVHGCSLLLLPLFCCSGLFLLHQFLAQRRKVVNAISLFSTIIRTWVPTSTPSHAWTMHVHITNNIRLMYY